DLYRHSFRITLRSQQESARSLKIWMRLRQPSSSLPDQQSRLRSKQKVSNRRENCEIGRIQRLRSEIPTNLRLDVATSARPITYRRDLEPTPCTPTTSSESSYSNIEPVADPGFGQDVLRLGRIGFDLLSKVGDKDAQVIGLIAIVRS